MESGKGKAWLYFVFAICQWLPTNYRINYYHDASRKRCNLCLCNSMDTMDHLLQCPALVKEHLHLKQHLDAKLKFWGIPYASTPPKPRDRELRKRWRSAVRERFTPDEISDSRLEILLKGFYKATAQNHLSRLVNFWKTYWNYSPTAGLHRVINSA